MRSRVEFRRVLLLVSLILIILLAVRMPTVYVNAVRYAETKFTTYYILHANTTAEDVNDVLLFNLPMNISDFSVEQKVLLVRVEGDFKVLREDDHIVLALPLNKSGGAEGYAFIKIETKFKLIIPSLYDNKPKSKIPEGILKEYVREPDEAVKSIEDEVDEYLKGHGVNMSNIVEVAYWTAKYIMENFEYEASGRPRTLGEVIATRKGDCDDLSELFINLMWRYGIPAQLEEVAICIDTDEVKEYEFDGSKVIYKNVGYHAYALVYMPYWGWIPVDITVNENGNPFSGSRVHFRTVIFDRVLERNYTSFSEFESFMKKYNTTVEEIYEDDEYGAEKEWCKLLGLPPPKKEELPRVVEVNVAPDENVTITCEGGIDASKFLSESESKVEILLDESKITNKITKMKYVAIIVFLALTAIPLYLVISRFRKLERSIEKNLKEVRKELERRNEEQMKF